jgi:hypothetical protein
MTAPDHIFQGANLFAMAGWLLLIVFPRNRWSAPLISGVIVPALLAAAYLAIILTHWGESGGGFSTLDAVTRLFQSRWLLLAGWLHYLAFDLFIGSWQVRDSVTAGVPVWLVIPCLVLTFLFGPAGLLLYLGLRAGIGGTSFSLGGFRSSRAGSIPER